MQINNDLKIARYLNGLEQISIRKPKKSIILFFGRSHFSDNSKYLFLKTIADFPESAVIWCSTNMELCDRLSRNGLKSFNISEDIGQTLALFTQAAIAVHCTNTFESIPNIIMRAALKGATHIQLWHGVSIKPLDMMNSQAEALLDINWIEQTLGAISIDIILSTSEHLDIFWQEAFGCKKIIRAGLPRNEVLHRPPSSHELINTLEETKSPLADDKKYILWVPTFTPDGSIPWWHRPTVITQLSSTASNYGYTLVIKPHPYDEQKFHNTHLIDFKNVIFVDPNIDIYPDLHKFSCLITDRSSLMFDFLQLNRPILILESSNQQNNTPVLWFDNLPVPAVCGFDVNSAEILEKCLTKDDKEDARKECLQKLFTTDHSDANNHIIKILKKILHEKIVCNLNILN